MMKNSNTCSNAIDYYFTKLYRIMKTIVNNFDWSTVKKNN